MPQESKIIRYETPESWRVAVTYPLGKGKIEMSLGGHTETQEQAREQFDSAIDKFSKDAGEIKKKLGL